MPSAYAPPELPRPVLALARALALEPADVYLVGGALRDTLLGRAPHDFDLATNLHPEQIAHAAHAHGWPTIPLGERFGTVCVVVNQLPIEVTTFRAEGRYLDGRRPSEVHFVEAVEPDLARRDFTVNAMAYRLPDGAWVDPFAGRADLRRGLVRAVGDPAARFAEDGLRLLRGVRLAAELEFRVEGATRLALATRAHHLGRVAAERVASELDRILLAPGMVGALQELAYSGLASVVLPELVPTIGLPPDHEYHALPLFEHLVEVARLTPARRTVRWAALFHDVGKPWTRTVEAVAAEEDGADGADGAGGADRPATGVAGASERIHYYGHDTLGAAMFAAAARRLRLERSLAVDVERLIRRHMFTFDMGPRGMRRLVAQFGEDGVRDLFDLKLADMVGTGGRYIPQACDAYLDFRARFREAVAGSRGLRVRDLAVDGKDVMRELGAKPGPIVGRVLNALLDEVLEHPEANERAHLLRRIQEVQR